MPYTMDQLIKRVAKVHGAKYIFCVGRIPAHMADPVAVTCRRHEKTTTTTLNSFINDGKGCRDCFKDRRMERTYERRKKLVDELVARGYEIEGLRVGMGERDSVLRTCRCGPKKIQLTALNYRRGGKRAPGCRVCEERRVRNKSSVI